MRDLRYAVRTLLGTPSVTVPAVLVLTLGIGATTAIFTVVNGVLFRPLPFAAPDRLVEIGTVGIVEFQAYRERSRAFEALVWYSTANKTLEGRDGPERVTAVTTEKGLFDLLGVRPLAGRVFTHADAPDVVVLSEGFWRRRFGAGTGLDNRTIVIDGRRHTVIGIMPASFQFPYRVTPTNLWYRRNCRAPITGFNESMSRSAG